MIHLIQKWLQAGVLEDGVLTVSDTGTGQGSVISPLLANVYLHYVFDLWANRWRHREATGNVIIVRYADDFIVGFEHEHDARRFWTAVRDRLEEFSLSLHPEKTRLIKFGRFVADRRAQRGLGKPETFNFLGFTFICSIGRNGKFLLKRKTRRDRLVAKLKQMKGEMRQRRHQSIPEQGKWLKQVLTGYFAYYAVQTNGRTLSGFRDRIIKLWMRSLQRRSQKTCMTWRADDETGQRLSPQGSKPPSVVSRSLRRQPPEVGAECPNWARSDLCGGRSVMGVPTAIFDVQRENCISLSTRRCLDSGHSARPFRRLGELFYLDLNCSWTRRCPHEAPRKVFQAHPSEFGILPGGIAAGGTNDETRRLRFVLGLRAFLDPPMLPWHQRQPSTRPGMVCCDLFPPSTRGS